jgi:hypothetical protein
MNRVSNIINLFSDVYCVSDMEFAKIHGEPSEGSSMGTGYTVEIQLQVCMGIGRV